jgi:hypothetical protein
MWARLRRFNALPRPAKALVLRVVVLLPLLTISLRMRGFGATQRFLRKFLAPSEHRPPVTGAADSRVALTSRMVLAAARNSFVPSTCLERSIAIWWLLARQGIATQLRIGVRKDQGKLAAHAWVEYQGNAIGEPESSHLHYAAFVEEMSGGLS